MSQKYVKKVEGERLKTEGFLASGGLERYLQCLSVPIALLFAVVAIEGIGSCRCNKVYGYRFLAIKNPKSGDRDQGLKDRMIERISPLASLISGSYFYQYLRTYAARTFGLSKILIDLQ